MALSPVAGSRIYIGGPLSDKNADFVAADFTSQTWIEIDGWQSAGSIGDSAQEIATDLINRGRTIVQKGTRRAPSMENTFAILPADPGQIALLAAEKTKSNYAFRVVGTDASDVKTAPVTVTIAAPGVFTWTAHGLAVDTPVKFSTTGALPTGVTAGTTYYVKTVPSADTFQIAATPGGAAITTTGTQSGVHTGTTAPTSSERQFIALVMGAPEQNGSANTIKTLSATLAINSNIVKIAAVG